MLTHARYITPTMAAGALAAAMIFIGSVHGQTVVTSPEQLRSVAAATPQEIVRARTFFEHTMPVDAMSRRVAGWDVDVRGFTFQGKEMTGGYTLSTGESMDEALASSKQGQDWASSCRRHGRIYDSIECTEQSE